MERNALHRPRVTANTQSIRPVGTIPELNDSIRGAVGEQRCVTVDRDGGNRFGLNRLCACQLPRHGIERSHSLVGAAREDQLPVSRDRNRVDGIGVPGEWSRSHLRQPPQFHRSIHAAGGQQALSRMVRYAGDGPCVSTQRRHGGPVRSLPDSHDAGSIPRNKFRAVRPECHRLHFGVMPCQSSNRLTGRTPKPHRLVGRTGRDELPVGTDRRPQHRQRVTRQRCGSCGEPPQSERSVTARRDDPQIVRMKRQPVDRSVVTEQSRPVHTVCQVP